MTNFISVTIYLPKKLKKAAQRKAKEMGISLSELARLAMDEYLKKLKPKYEKQ